jgi:hypothetical protein
MQKRTAALIAGSAAAVAMTVTGVTYASADAPQSASSAREAVRPASAPLGGDSDYDGYRKDHNGYKKDNSGSRTGGGQIQINERTYSANPGACVSVTNFNTLSTGTFNISNDTDRVVEFFDGTNCNSGNPVAVVLPGTASFGVGAGDGSFRVIDN